MKTVDVQVEPPELTEAEYKAAVVEWLSPGQLNRMVQARSRKRKEIGKKCSPSSIAEWRKVLNFREPPFNEVHAIALAYFGDLLAVSTPKAKAKQMTLDYLRTLSEKENTDG